jgi:hypothetical protein
VVSYYGVSDVPHRAGQRDPGCEPMHDTLAAAGVPGELTLIDAVHAEPTFYSTPALQQQLLRFLGTALTPA